MVSTVPLAIPECSSSARLNLLSLEIQSISFSLYSSFIFAAVVQWGDKHTHSSFHKFMNCVHMKTDVLFLFCTLNKEHYYG